MDEQVVNPAAEEETAVAAEEAAQEPEKPSKDFLDKTWDFFASVPVGIFLIFIIAAASVGGTLIPQEGMYSDWRPPQDFYPAQYGAFWGSLLFKTGMTRMYTSWWFMSLLFMMGASLVICSIERFVPLWKAVQRPNIAPPESFVKHLKSRFEYKPAAGADPLSPVAAALKSARYTVVQKDGRLYADKGRWGRWGPYILHVGLLLVLAGAMVRVFPGAYMDQFVWVRDGSIVKVPGANWFIKNEKFTVESYENGQPKSYETEATVVEADGTEVKKHTISMNNPLSHRWIELYQSSYKQELGKAKVMLKDRASGAEIGTFDLDLYQPEKEYKVGDYTVKIAEYFPDFGLEGGKPVSRSSEVQNPGVVLDIIGKDGKAYRNWYFVMYPEMEFDAKTPVKLSTADMVVTSTTGLKVKKDLGIPVIWFGLIIASLAVCATFYIPHRRYWALVEGGRVVVGGWTNRNHRDFQTEMARFAHRIDPKNHATTDETEGEER
ncbi:MAG TPA: cytochrome c biogenesis protein ResB [Symbiobacteriaceae bacterium]|nr:cytochrome c biogenesis protein ResB [Symbiobacteriaceae bacterium]